MGEGMGDTDERLVPVDDAGFLSVEGESCLDEAEDCKKE